MTWRDPFRQVGPGRSSVVTIGTFDGVHRGHQHLIGRAVQIAREAGREVVAVTFNPRPAEILRPNIPSQYLCSIDERCRRLRQAGVDEVVVVPFSRELSEVTAEDFCVELVHSLAMRCCVGGPDLTIGRGREGTAAVLRGIGARLGFGLEVVDGFCLDGQIVRTRSIRAALSEGNVSLAREFLGRGYTIDGKVVRGDGRGRTIGVPTANVAVDPALVLPANGVYAVRFRVGVTSWNGAANLGVRPTFGGASRSLEVHLLDFSGDLYDRECSVEFVRRIRPEQRFGGVDELVAQIRQDIVHARQVLGSS
jgi:riboflavin kinase/FMN adenylyltransferase